MWGGNGVESNNNKVLFLWAKIHLSILLMLLADGPWSATVSNHPFSDPISCAKMTKQKTAVADSSGQNEAFDG